MRTLAFVVLAGCGRIGFADHGDAAGAVADTPAPLGDNFGNARALPNVSSPNREFGASIAPDGLALYFMSNRMMGNYFAWVATRATTADDFGTPTPGMFGGATYPGEPAAARDDVEMYFANPGAASGSVATRAMAGAAWGAPVTVPAFAGFGGFDIGGHDLRMVMQGSDDQLYEAVRADRTSAWQPPTRIAEVIGYRMHQNYATMTDDGLEVFFQAFDDSGLGTILHVRRPALDQPFGTATSPLVVPPNLSIGDPGISGDGRTLYYSANAAGSADDNLYVADRLP